MAHVTCGPGTLRIPSFPLSRTGSSVPVGTCDENSITLLCRVPDVARDPDLRYKTKMSSFMRHRFRMILLTIFFMAACKDGGLGEPVNNQPPDSCGNGRLDPGEVCDPGLFPLTGCEAIDGFLAGTPGCSTDCRFLDTEDCIPERVDGATAFFSGETLPEIDIRLSRSAIDALWQVSSAYVPADLTVRIDGILHELPQTGVRLKGRYGSFRTLDGKAAFLLNFDRFVDGRRFLGIEKLALNNMVQDPSMIHEHLGYRLFAGMGVPSPRCGYARVFVNGEPYGLYATVEAADNRDLLSWWFGGRGGNLYEGEYGVDLFDELIGYFDQDNGEDVGFADLQELTDHLDKITDPGAFMEEAGRVIDLESFLRFAATEIFLGHWDGYAWTRNNYFIYRREHDGRWVFLPWGIDQIFEAYLDNWGGQGRLQQMCMRSLDCRTALGLALQRVIRTVEQLGLEKEPDRLRERLREAIEADPRKEVSVGTVADGIRRVKEFLAQRPQTVWERMDCVDPAFLDEDGDGASGCGFDCDDHDPEVYPGAPEICNGRDDDCDGQIDNHPDCPRCHTVDHPSGGQVLFCFHHLGFMDAEMDCVNQGGHLVSIHDFQTQQWLAATALGISWQEWWIGASDLDEEGRFAWTDGSPFDAAFWADGEPNNYDQREHCAHLASWADGLWNDIPCDAGMFYVCHVP